MNKLARNTLALGTATLIVTAGLSFSANGADKIVAQSEASAITATGITGIIDTQACTASSTGPASQGTGICGTGLSVSGTAVGVIDQNASTGLSGANGTSEASARVASVDLPALTSINLANLQGSVSSINTGTILDDIVDGLNDPVLEPLFVAALTPLLSAIQTAAVTPLTTGLQGALPVAVEIGAVSSKCTAVAGGTPTLSSSVAGIDVRVTLPAGGDIVVPVALSTTPNAALIGPAAPQQLVDGVLDGLEASLNQSLNGVLGPLAALVGTVQTQLVDAILAQLGPALLAPLGQALEPVIDGTVNKQDINSDGSVEVTALDLNLIGKTATTAIARSKCGPNSAVVVTTPTPTKTTPTKNTADDGSQTDEDADGTTPVDNVDDSDTIADADAQADADVTTTLPATGAPNLLPFWLLGIALLMFGGAVLVNEKRRLSQI